MCCFFFFLPPVSPLLSVPILLQSGKNRGRHRNSYLHCLTLVVASNSVKIACLVLHGLSGYLHSCPWPGHE